MIKINEVFISRASYLTKLQTKFLGNEKNFIFDFIAVFS